MLEILRHQVRLQRVTSTMTPRCERSFEEGYVFPEKSFATGELTLNYAEGTTSGPPLVLLHGLTGRWQAWQTMMPSLTLHWHVYAFDLRGHGKSGRMADQYQVADYAGDVVAFLQQLGQSAVLMGHSLGALVALATATAWPGGTRAVVLLDPPLYLRNSSMDARPDVREWFRWVYDTVSSSSSYEDIVAQCRALSPDADEDSITAMADEISGVAADAVRLPLQDRVLGALDLGRALRHVQCPLLLMHGDWAHGATMRDEDAEFVHANLPSAVTVKITNGSHLFFQEQQETVLQQVREFLPSP